ncbi:MAG: M48 family metallopeptidase [Lachnospiraceae bacterium]|nr:M48 family metallopeptidase [Lachnospiraceae bacterium]
MAVWTVTIGGTPHKIRVTYKRMRTIRLRVMPGGELRLSAPMGVRTERLESFLKEHESWIMRQMEVMKNEAAAEKLPPLSKEEREAALAYLEPIVDRLHPIVAACGVARPHVTVRAMRTRFGSCSVGRGRITLNAVLIKAPLACAEYVVLHELAHFLYPNHSGEFYAFIERYMPDWKERERMLQREEWR